MGRVAALSVTAAVAGLMGAAAGLSAARAPASAMFTEWRQPGYAHVSPLLDCDARGPSEAPMLRALRARLAAEVEQARARGDVERASVYFRDLATGAWAGVDEDAPFIPASLLKVAPLVVLLQAEERAPGTLDREVEVPSTDARVPQALEPADPVQPGRRYALRELARHMIVESDNAAASTLWKHLGQDAFRQVFVDLGVVHPGAPTGETWRMGAREYATFFRALFNASYLGRASSEEALRLMTQSSFRDGLVAGVPPGVEVAHKFGERHEMDGGRIAAHQLHDCGVVYHPRRPYLLCVMTRGHALAAQAAVIRALSAHAWAHVEAPGDAP